ncbi:MAG: tRNA lysidine(34) synthetase TilS [Sneathiellaceae bacterium]
MRTAPDRAATAPDLLPARFAAALAALGLECPGDLPGDLPGPLVVAVSGGGDSMALLHLMRSWCGDPRRLLAAVVDHRLRPGSAAEARQVAAWAAGLGVPYRILRRDGPLAGGGLQEAARDLRYRLLARGAAEAGAAAILLAHTRDDQIETLAMRSRRGGGPAGLGGMAPVTRRLDLPGAPLLLRPLLDFDGQTLRQWLHRRGLDWLEDPSNRDRRFERVRVRQDLQAGGAARWAAGCRDLAEGAAAARRLAADRDRQAAGLLAIAYAPCPHGADRLSTAALAAAGAVLACHTLRGLLRSLGRAAYPPRRAAVQRLWQELRRGTAGATLAGSRFVPLPGGDYLVLRDRRSALPVLPLAPGPERPWGHRFRLHVGGAVPPGLDLRELGAYGLRRLERLLAGPGDLAGIPGPARPGLPALFAGPRLVALPTLGRFAPHLAGLAGRVAVSRQALQPFAERRWERLPGRAAMAPPGGAVAQDAAAPLVRRCAATYLE